MTDTSDLRELLLTYKLGELSPEDRERLDAQMVGDREFSDRLADAEYDLLDDYHAGRLSRAQCRRLEKAFSPQELRRGRAVAAGGAVRPVRAARPARLRFARSAAVAASILAAAVVFLFIFLHKSQSRPEVARTQPPSSSTVVVAPHTPTAPTPPNGSSKNATETGAPAVLLLQSAVARGAAAAVLELSPSVHAVRVQWVVPPAVSAQPFSLSVTRAGSVLTKVNQHGGVQDANASQVVEFDLEASIFARYPQNARFLFVVYAGRGQRTSVGEYPVVLRKE